MSLLIAKNAGAPLDFGIFHTKRTSNDFRRFVLLIYLKTFRMAAPLPCRLNDRDFSIFKADGVFASFHVTDHFLRDPLLSLIHISEPTRRPG